jgi:hypothetical protein
MSTTANHSNININTTNPNHRGMNQETIDLIRSLQDGTQQSALEQMATRRIAPGPLAGFCTLKQIEELNETLAAVLRDMDNKERPMALWNDEEIVVVDGEEIVTTKAVDVLLAKTRKSLQSFHMGLDVTISPSMLGGTQMVDDVDDAVDDDIVDVDTGTNNKERAPTQLAAPEVTNLMQEQAQELNSFLTENSTALVRVLGALPASDAVPIKNNIHGKAFEQLLNQALHILATHKEDQPDPDEVADLGVGVGYDSLTHEQKTTRLTATLTWVYSMLLLDRIEQLRTQSLLRAVFGKDTTERCIMAMEHFFKQQQQQQQLDNDNGAGA